MLPAHHGAAAAGELGGETRQEVTRSFQVAQREYNEGEHLLPGRPMIGDHQSVDHDLGHPAEPAGAHRREPVEFGGRQDEELGVAHRPHTGSTGLAGDHPDLPEHVPA